MNLARALALEPALLLLDEPAAALDAESRQAFLADVEQALDARTTTVVHVSHRPEEAFRLADRVAVLINGAIRQLGTPEALMREPAEPSWHASSASRTCSKPRWATEARCRWRGGPPAFIARFTAARRSSPHGRPASGCGPRGPGDPGHGGARLARTGPLGDHAVRSDAAACPGAAQRVTATSG